ncbi:peptide/nickel transport system substrate-binding protein [Pseudochelatococcus lubricantis]|uniref:Peptide/nickel transport system substrate-binding protein n=1 Tax=Pseudochelatococcus lubricantis TaxID=1538102 RepID=A0ABX0V5U2_9HYPH|nr:ABC transporter substrate-binding protein [Pseudochelatococcus lubricantis]NIJ59155.1 peptide/nickel transport system substrate-binding protein [Pseudochelatococcus lubricantis]
MSSTFSRSRRELLQSSLSVTLLASLGVPSVVFADDAAAPVHGGTLTFLVYPEPTSLVSIATTSGAEQRVSSKVHEGLLKYDFDLTPQPQLATGWTVSPDGKLYTFSLREGVRWHDGKPFRAVDVVRSIELLKAWHPRGKQTFANVEALRAPDDHTVEIALSQPAPYLLYALSAAESPIVAAHVYDSLDSPAKNPASLSPIGTGAYIFRAWERGTSAVFERNPDYWDQPKPYVDRLVARFIADINARTAALETGELLVASENPVALSEIKRLQALPHIAYTQDGYSYSPNQHQLEFNLDKPYFKDLRVRQAIAHAIDRQTILDVVYNGYGIVAPSPISPLLKRFYYDGVETYPFDLDKANALLNEAGYPRGPDGVRFRITHDYLPYGSEFQNLAAYLKNNLARIGIDVTIRSQDLSAWIKRVYTDRDFDFVSNGLSNTFDPTVGVQRGYWSKSFVKGVPFSNASHYANSEVDALLETAAIEPDEKKRYDLFARFQQIVAREIPLINTITVKQVTLFNRKVHDHTVTADGLRGNLADVFIKE